MDFTDKNIRLNSPLSKKALLKLGLDENKLYEITIGEYIQRNKELEDSPKELVDKRFYQFNTRRLNAIEEARKLRMEMIEDIEKLKNKSKSSMDLLDYNENNNKEKILFNILPGSRQQLKNMVQYELKQKEYERRSIKKRQEIEENLKKIKEEKNEKEEQKKFKKEILLGKMKINKSEINLEFLKRQEEIKKRQDDIQKNSELKRNDILEKLKCLKEKRNERYKNALEKRKLEDLIREEKRKELERRMEQEKKNLQLLIKKVEPWGKEEEELIRKKKMEKLYINSHFQNYMKNMEEYNNTKRKLLNMKKEKISLLNQKSECLAEKIKFREERSLECLKKNAIYDDIKIQNIIDKELKTEEKVKEQKEEKNINMKNKALYMELNREDIMNNLKMLEKKREYEREKIILKLLYKDKQLMEYKKSRNIDSGKNRFLKLEMSALQNKLIKKTRLNVRSGKYRNSKEVYDEIVNNSAGDIIINQTEI